MAQALGLAGPAPDDALAALRSTLARLWGLRWENEHKEPFWRLALNGFAFFAWHDRTATRAAAVAGAAGTGTSCPGLGLRGRGRGRGRGLRSGGGRRGGGAPRCPCGALMMHGPREHHFWSCPVARALCEYLQELGSIDIGRAHLWLVQPPTNGIKQPVWDVVCLAAVAALEKGRQALYGARRGRCGTAPVACVRRVGCRVIADFASRLWSFAALGARPRGWEVVSGTHVFLGSSASGRVVCRVPLDADSSSDSSSDSDG